MAEPTPPGKGSEPEAGSAASSPEASSKSGPGLGASPVAETSLASSPGSGAGHGASSVAETSPASSPSWGADDGASSVAETSSAVGAGLDASSVAEMSSASGAGGGPGSASNAGSGAGSGSGSGVGDGSEAQRPSPADELEDSRMPFLEHLRELRVRLRNAVIALILGFIIAFVFSQELFVILARPLVAVWAEVSVRNPSLGAPMLYFGSLVEPFWVYLSVALWGGIFVASPAIFHQLWLFVAPGLYRHERRYGIAFAGSSAVLFVGGAIFCYILVLPAAYRFFLNYSTNNLADLQRGFGVLSAHANAIALQPLLGMDAYLDFVKKLLLGFALVFELPLLIMFLTLAGAVTHRSLWRFNRWFIVLSFVVAAMLTPGPDVISQILMALPMVVLYNGSILVAYFIARRRAAAARAAEASYTADD